MTDPCKNCIHRGVIEDCEAEPCVNRESWYISQLQQKIEVLEIMEFMATVKYTPYADIEEALGGHMGSIWQALLNHGWTPPEESK